MDSKDIQKTKILKKIELYKKRIKQFSDSISIISERMEKKPMAYNNEKCIYMDCIMRYSTIVDTYFGMYGKQIEKLRGLKV